MPTIIWNSVHHEAILILRCIIHRSRYLLDRYALYKISNRIGMNADNDKYSVVAFKLIFRSSKNPLIKIIIPI